MGARLDDISLIGVSLKLLLDVVCF